MSAQLICPACVSFDVTLPHQMSPDNDARCESCGLVFGPQCPGPETDVNAFIDAVPASALIFGGYAAPASMAQKSDMLWSFIMDNLELFTPAEQVETYRYDHTAKPT